MERYSNLYSRCSLSESSRSLMQLQEQRERQRGRNGRTVIIMTFLGGQSKRVCVSERHEAETSSVAGYPVCRRVVELVPKRAIGYYWASMGSGILHCAYVGAYGCVCVCVCVYIYTIRT